MENYFLSKDELVELIRNKVSPIECNMIISAYDMADMAYLDKKTISGEPYFFHTTRVARLLMKELEITEPDLIIAALLHDLYKTSEEISDEIISFNFNPYVAYLVNALKEDFDFIKHNPFLSDDEGRVKIPADDYLIIWLAEHLDNLRFSSFTPEYNPVNYILNITANFLPAAETNQNSKIQYLVAELKKERNRILS